MGTGSLPRIFSYLRLYQADGMGSTTKETLGSLLGVWKDDNIPSADVPWGIYGFKYTNDGVLGPKYLDLNRFIAFKLGYFLGVTTCPCAWAPRWIHKVCGSGLSIWKVRHSGVG